MVDPSDILSDLRQVVRSASFSGIMGQVTSEELPQPRPDRSKSFRNWSRNAKNYIRRRLSYGKQAVVKLLLVIKQAVQSISSTCYRFGKKFFFLILGFCAIAFMTAQVVGFNGSIWPVVISVTVVLVAAAGLSNIPRRIFVILFVNTFGWLPVTLGSVSYFFWYPYAEDLEHPESTFFHASADVLPVLLLAAVVDVRRSKTLESKGLVLPIIAVFLGEVAALNALAFGYTGPRDFAVVASSLVSTTFALVLAVMADLPERSNDKKKKTAISEDGAFSDEASDEEIVAKERSQADDNQPAGHSIHQI